jgi:RHS repeat-associated protein
MEKDDEIKGEGNSYDFGARMLDPRIGRWLKMDPLSIKYPYDSPYMVSGSSPISIIDPDGKRKRKITIETDLNGNVKKISVVHVNYSLKSQIRQTGNDPFSGDAVITYDYYDTVDIEYIVKDKKGKVFSKIVTKDIKSDLRFKDKTFTPKAMLEAADALDDAVMSIPTEEKDDLTGNYKGHFKGGIDLILDDNDNILNVRGLEKVNSSPNPEKIEISELLVIAQGQTGATLPKAISNIGKIGDGQKAIEQAETAIKYATEAHSKCTICERYYNRVGTEVDSTKLTKKEKSGLKAISPNEHK